MIQTRLNCQWNGEDDAFGRIVLSCVGHVKTWLHAPTLIDPWRDHL